MTALELITASTHAIYVLVFVLVFLRTVRQPTPAHLDMTAFFGVVALIVLESRIVPLVGGTPPVWMRDAVIILLMAMPYLLLRLVNDFTIVPTVITRLVEVGFIAFIVLTVSLDAALPPTLALVYVAYFAIVSLYCAARFVGAGRRALGVTRRRLEAVSLGSILLGGDLVFAGLGAFLAEPERTVVSAMTQLMGLGSALSYYVGFAPPVVLRRAWQAPELRAFLTRAAQLPRLPTTLDIVRELEAGAAASTGSSARIGLWNEDDRVIRMWQPGNDEAVEVKPGQFLAGRAFERQSVLYSGDPVSDDPENAARYRNAQVGAVIAAPITAGGRRLGVLVLFATRPPIFALSDLELAQLLADQASVILESRALIDHAARVKAREEATRMKEDFVSAAAHDLKTPLTTVVAQAEFLERKALRDPAAPPDVPGLQRIVRESKRLAALVTDLLDASRLEQGKLVGEREPVDVGALVTEVVGRQQPGIHLCDVDVRGAVVGTYDRRRIEQLVENLVENAKKYSPEAARVRVEVWQQDGEARIVVRDQGIGIPAADLPTIFERFARASNVDDRKFHGMGLGLYICRGIVEEHGGRIWAESEMGKGSTFHVALPLREGRRLN
ncbi:MAG TPA: ATP-binding protein [Candidatus Limnocylindria bacterium]|nr:ATP-binding protein [Candidatus Limnocylindria bacterium]